MLQWIKCATHRNVLDIFIEKSYPMVSKYATFCPEIEIVQKMSTFAIKTFETFDGARPRNKLTCRKIGSDLSFLEYFPLNTKPKPKPKHLTPT